MPGLIPWKNQEINKFRRDIDRLFDRMWDEFRMPLSLRIVRGVPSIDLSETEEELIIKAEIPGINPEDLDISVTDDTLTIKGETKQEIIEEKEDHHRTERQYGSFSRSLQLPCRIMAEDVKATYKKGILSITMPKCKADTTQGVKVKVRR